MFQEMASVKQLPIVNRCLPHVLEDIACDASGCLHDTKVQRLHDASHQYPKCITG